MPEFHQRGTDTPYNEAEATANPEYEHTIQAFCPSCVSFKVECSVDPEDWDKPCDYYEEECQSWREKKHF